MTKIALIKHHGIVVKITVDGVTIFDSIQPPQSYYELCCSHGWSGEFDSVESAEEFSKEMYGFIRSVREVKPTDPNYSIDKKVYTEEYYCAESGKVWKLR